MNTSKTPTTSRFIVDFLGKQIIGTKASFDKASKGISPIYEELTAKINAHPTFALTVKEQKHKSTKVKRTYEGLNFKFIEDYISIQEAKRAAAIMAEYVSVKAFAEDSGLSIYPFVKKWFLGEFDPDGNGFDMAAAKKAVADAKMAEALLNASPIPAAPIESIPAALPEAV